MNIMDKNKKIRGYLKKYLEFGFIPSKHDSKPPFCLICGQSFSNELMKFGRLKNHFLKKHNDKKDKNLEYFEGLKNSFEKRNTINLFLTAQNDKSNRTLETSFKISLMIAKNGKPHTLGEDIIKPAIACFVKDVLKLEDTEVQNLSLSNNTVRSRIDTMSNDVENQLITKLRNTTFSLQLDESTVRDGELLLLAYVRYVENDIFNEEFLFCKSLKHSNTSLELYNVLKSYLNQNEIPFENIISCAGDGAPSMMEKNNGCLKLIKDQSQNLLIVHCVIHRENLIAKKLSPELHAVLFSIIRCINTIKRSAKNEKLFQRFCENMSTDHIRLLMHTEVRWLSKGNCLKRFVELYDIICNFLKDSDEMKNLMTEDGKSLLCYLADIFQKFNYLNLQLQGADITPVDAKTRIFGFLSLIRYCKDDVQTGNYDQFTNLNKCSISENVKEIVLKHLESLLNDFNVRFCDLKDMEFLKWLLQPLIVDISSIDKEVKDEFHLLQNDESIISLFQIKGIMMWISKEIMNKYPKSSKIARNLLLPFPTSYLVECGFSAVTDILTKKRNRLDITLRGDLRLKLTKLMPDIKAICDKIQYQPSH